MLVTRRYVHSIIYLRIMVQHTPLGTMLVVPGASYRADSATEAIHASYVFAHGVWNAPAMVLPAVHKVSDAGWYSA